MSNLLTVAEKALARGQEIIPSIDSKVSAISDLCGAFASSDPSVLAKHLGMPADAAPSEVQAVAWKALLTLRLEVDLTAAALSMALGNAFKAAQAAHAQRDLSLMTIGNIAGQCQQMLHLYAGKAAQAGNVAIKLLEHQGIALDVPTEILAQQQQILAANGQPVASS